MHRVMSHYWRLLKPEHVDRLMTGYNNTIAAFLCFTQSAKHACLPGARPDLAHAAIEVGRLLQQSIVKFVYHGLYTGLLGLYVGSSPSPTRGARVAGLFGQVVHATRGGLERFTLFFPATAMDLILTIFLLVLFTQLISWIGKSLLQELVGIFFSDTIRGRSADVPKIRYSRCTNVSSIVHKPLSSAGSKHPYWSQRRNSQRPALRISLPNGPD